MQPHDGPGPSANFQTAMRQSSKRDKPALSSEAAERVSLGGGSFPAPLIDPRPVDTLGPSLPYLKPKTSSMPMLLSNCFAFGLIGNQ